MKILIIGDVRLSLMLEAKEIWSEVTKPELSGLDNFSEGKGVRMNAM